MKASFALWFPVVVAFHIGMRQGDSIDDYVEFSISSEIHKIRRAAAAAWIALFAANRSGVAWTDDLPIAAMLRGASGTLLCAASALLLVVHYAVVERAGLHERFEAFKWSTIVSIIEISRLIIISLVIAALGFWALG